MAQRRQACTNTCRRCVSRPFWWLTRTATCTRYAFRGVPSLHHQTKCSPDLRFNSTVIFSRHVMTRDDLHSGCHALTPVPQGSSCTAMAHGWLGGCSGMLCQPCGLVSVSTCTCTMPQN